MLIHPVTSVEILVMITGIVQKKLTWSLKMLGRTQKQKGYLEINAQTAIDHIWEFVLVHGVINLVILLRIVWSILLIAACEPDFLRKKR